MKGTLRASAAEMIGTFTLVFLGAGAGALSARSGSGLVGVALAHGIALMIIVYAWGGVSGAHVNPAVTFGLMLTGKVPIVRGIAYWIAQFIGAGLAGFLLVYLLGFKEGLGETIGEFTRTDPLKTVFVEAILTFFLVTAVYGSTVAGKNGNAVGLAIGMVLTADILMGGELTGASMNPARTFGPWLANLTWESYIWMYFAGPMLGAAVAALVYHTFFLTRDEPKPVA